MKPDCGPVKSAVNQTEATSSPVPVFLQRRGPAHRMPGLTMPSRINLGRDRFKPSSSRIRLRQRPIVEANRHWYYLLWRPKKKTPSRSLGGPTGAPNWRWQREK